MEAAFDQAVPLIMPCVDGAFPDISARPGDDTCAHRPVVLVIAVAAARGEVLADTRVVVELHPALVDALVPIIVVVQDLGGIVARFPSIRVNRDTPRVTEKVGLETVPSRDIEV